MTGLARFDWQLILSRTLLVTRGNKLVLVGDDGVLQQWGYWESLSLTLNYRLSLRSLFHRACKWQDFCISIASLLSFQVVIYQLVLTCCRCSKPTFFFNVWHFNACTLCVLSWSQSSCLLSFACLFWHKSLAYTFISQFAQTLAEKRSSGLKRNWHCKMPVLSITVLNHGQLSVVRFDLK